MASFIGGFIALGLSEGSVQALFWAFIAHSLYSRKECDECLLSTSSAPVAGHREILAERGGRFFFNSVERQIRTVHSANDVVTEMLRPRFLSVILLPCSHLVHILFEIDISASLSCE